MATTPTTTNLAASVAQNLDIKSLVTSLVNAEKKPLTDLQATKSVTNTKISKFGQLQNLRENAFNANEKVKKAIENSGTNDEISAAIKAQIAQINSYYTNLKSVTDIKATLNTDRTAQSVKSNFRTTISAALYGTEKTTTFLSTNKDGTIALDESKLTSALADSNTKVSIANIASTLSDTLSDTSYAASIMDSRVTALQSQNKSTDTRIDNYNKYLDQRQSILTNQFMALQKALLNYSAITFNQQ